MANQLQPLPAAAVPEVLLVLTLNVSSHWNAGGFLVVLLLFLSPVVVAIAKQQDLCARLW